MKYLGYFSEMNLYEDSGPLSENIIEEVSYDKEKVIKYLLSQKRIAGCPKKTIDCGTTEVIANSFSVYSDGEYEWCDFLPYHIRKYNIKLPQDFIAKVNN